MRLVSMILGKPSEAVYMEKTLETVWVGLQLGLGGVSGYHQGGANDQREVSAPD